MSKTLTKEFWRHIESNQNKVIYKRVYNWLNKDNLSDIVLDGKVFWIELTRPSNNTIPDYIHAFIIKWATKLGYIHLYSQ